jgi:predicted nucleic acid-binding protein
MSGFLLDTNVHRRSQLEQWLERDLRDWFEGRILRVDAPVADRFGVLRAQAQLKGRPLSVVDALLAATAYQNDLTLVSRNVSDFAVTGVALVNPWEARV